MQDPVALIAARNRCFMLDHGDMTAAVVTSLLCQAHVCYSYESEICVSCCWLLVASQWLEDHYQKWFQYNLNVLMLLLSSLSPCDANGNQPYAMRHIDYHKPGQHTWAQAFDLIEMHAHHAFCRLCLGSKAAATAFAVPKPAS